VDTVTAKALRFSTVDPQEVAEVARLRDIHRGNVSPPNDGDGVPAGVQEQAIEAAVAKSLPRLVLVLKKSYVKAHTRTLPNGRTITVHPYFNKRIPKGDGPKKGRAAKGEPPPSGVYQALRPEHLSARLVRHVEEGTLTHADAHANLEHLARRAHAGHHLEHGQGPAWTPEQTHAFIAHARGALHAHETEQKRQHEEAEQRKQEEERDRQYAERQRWVRIEDAVDRLDTHITQHKLGRDEIEQGIAQLEESARTGEGLEEGFTQDDMREVVRRLREKYPTPTAEERKKEEERQKRRDRRQQQKEREREKQQGKDQDTGGIDYSAIQDTETRIPQERKLHAEHFLHAPPYIQAAIRKAPALNQINPKGSRGSFCQGLTKTISFRPQSRLKRFPDYAGPVWRHEYGHHVDFWAGYYSPEGQGQAYVSYQARDAMEQDRTELLKEQPSIDDRQTMFFRIKDQLDAFIEHGQEPATAYAHAWAQHGLDDDALGEFFGAGWRDQKSSWHADRLSAWERKDAKRFFDLAPSESRHGMAQDFIGAVTRNSIMLAWNHTDKYYRDNRAYNYRHTTEAYADWFSCHGAGFPVWRKVLAHFAPATTARFKELTDQWLTSTPPARA
jgi:hypothetical protein